MRLPVHTLVIVDEAAMVGTNDLRELLAADGRKNSSQYCFCGPGSSVARFGLASHRLGAVMQDRYP
jgi:hypothetical protein